MFQDVGTTTLWKILVVVFTLRNAHGFANLLITILLSPMYNLSFSRRPLGKYAVSGQRRHCILPAQTYLQYNMVYIHIFTYVDFIYMFYCFYSASLVELLISGLMVLCFHSQQESCIMSWHTIVPHGLVQVCGLWWVSVKVPSGLALSRGNSPSGKQLTR